MRKKWNVWKRSCSRGIGKSSEENRLSSETGRFDWVWLSAERCQLELFLGGAANKLTKKIIKVKKNTYRDCNVFKSLQSSYFCEKTQKKKKLWLLGIWNFHKIFCIEFFKTNSFETPRNNLYLFSFERYVLKEIFRIENHDLIAKLRNRVSLLRCFKISTPIIIQKDAKPLYTT